MEQKRRNSLAIGIALGVAVGTAIGTALDNVALGIPIGIALGAAIGSSGVFAPAGKSGAQDATDVSENDERTTDR